MFTHGARLALAVLLAAPPLAAQSNLERVVNGAFTASHDYDLIHQRIDVRNFDWDSTSFDGRVTTTVVALRPGLDAIVLDMARTLEVRSVTPVCARRGACPTLAFDRPGDSLVVRLARLAAFGDTVRFSVDYHGRIRQGYGLYFFKADGRPHRPQQVYSGGGTDGNPRWLPTWGGPADKATWELSATVPATLTVVSNGRLVSDRPSPGKAHTVTWRQDKPASTYLISLAAAPFAKVSDRWRGIPVDYYVYREDSALARPLFGLTPDMMETYSRLTGVPYPWNKYAQVTVADFIGGMENVSATTLVDWLPDARAYLDRPWYRQSLIPHELAHQWFGDLVTAENWANYWLNEGMAEFMPGQYWGAKQGAHAEQDYYLAEYRQFLGADARRRMPLATYNSNNVYPKGALVLEMLKTQLGRRAVLGGDAPLSDPPCLRLGDERRPPSGRARRHGSESRLVLVPVDLLGGIPGLQPDVGLRLDGARAHAHGASDSGGYRHRGQQRRSVRDASRISGADRDPRRDLGGRRGAPGDDRSPGADRPHRQPARRPDHGGVRRRQRRGQDARLRAAHRLAGRPCSTVTRISGTGPGPSSSSARARRIRWRVWRSVGRRAAPTIRLHGRRPPPRWDGFPSRWPCPRWRPRYGTRPPWSERPRSARSPRRAVRGPSPSRRTPGAATPATRFAPPRSSRWSGSTHPTRQGRRARGPRAALVSRRDPDRRGERRDAAAGLRDGRGDCPSARRAAVAVARARRPNGERQRPGSANSGTSAG